MDSMLDLTKSNIQEVVNQSMEQVVVVAFWSKTQPQSLACVQTLEQLAQGRYILAKVNCDEEMEIAGYFQIQTLPTVLILSQGQPVDGLVGEQDVNAINQMLEKHLPPLWQVKLDQAKAILATQPDDNALTKAISLLLQAQTDAKGKNDDITLVLADAYLQSADFVAAKAMLDNVGLAGQDSYYQNLLAKLTLALEAADTPEIRELQDKFDQNQDDIVLRQSLAKALHQAHRNEEALDLLFAVLNKEINIDNGNVKQLFLEILTAIGQGQALANQYRRKLYSLLY